MPAGGYRFDIDFTYDEKEYKKTQGRAEKLFSEVVQYFNRTSAYDPILNQSSDTAKEEIKYAADSPDWRRITIQVIFTPAQLPDDFDPEEFKQQLEAASFTRRDSFERVTYRRTPTAGY